MRNGTSNGTTWSEQNNQKRERWMMSNTQVINSYNRHRDHELWLSQREYYPSCYSSPQSVDAWLEDRKKSYAKCLLEVFSDSTWMTIGDGAYGSDAHYLKQNGADVTASSLTEHTLSVAKEKGYVDRYRIENAERLTASDDSFDFIFCKESYHHFPRPPLGFYEMLRVARIAVILIEPQASSAKLMDHVKNLIKRIIRGDRTMLFEANGNFIFRINPRELMKMMTALNLEFAALQKFNDFYHPKLSHTSYTRYSLKTIATKIGIAIQNVLCVLHLLDYGGVAFIAFKEVPSEDVQVKLKQNGFRCILLPKNPYKKAQSG